MVFNSALCFVLIALALASQQLGGGARARAVQVVLGTAVLVFSAAIFSQYVSRVDLGLDYADSQSVTPDDPYPGRIPGPSALAFMLCGALLVVMHGVRTLWGGLLVQAMTALVAAAGLLGLLGHVIPLRFFYDNYVFGQMALSSAGLFIAAGAGFWWSWRRDPWFTQRRLIRSDDQRIALIGVLTLGLSVCIAVVAGFVLMVRYVENLAGDSQLDLLESDVTLFRLNLAQRLDRITLLVDRPVLSEELHRLNGNVGDPSVAARLREGMKDLTGHGFNAVEIKDARGRVWVSEGRFLPEGEVAVPLKANFPAVLFWEKGLVLRTEVPVQHRGQRVASIRMEQRLPVLSNFLSSPHGLEQTGEILVCGRDEKQFLCFPQLRNPRPYTLPYSPHLPIGMALEGRTGVVTGRDYVGQNVVAAHGPVGDFGLGMVVKVDTAELFLPLRNNMYQLLLAMVIIIAAGGWLLYRSVKPLAYRLEFSENRLQQALEGSRIALWDWDFKTGTVYLSERWAEMMGEPPFPMTMQADKLQSMVHPEDISVLTQHLQQVLKGKEQAYDLEHRIVLRGGRERWIRSRGKVAARDAAGRVLRMVGTNVDISRRKEAELLLAHQAGHDALTGLPNRLFFKDRLGQAMARARRQATPMAVMYMDIDKFKGINDTLGHEAGDVLLREFARRISGVLRTTDTAVRLGGDEFVLILESLGGREDAERVAAKVATAMQPPFIVGKGTLRITTSGGLALYDAQSRLNGDELLRQADEALYEAKAAGRNNIKIAG